MQPYQTFDVALAAPGTPQPVVVCSMYRGARRLSLVVEGGDVEVWIQDGPHLRLRKGEAWSEEAQQPILQYEWTLWFVNVNAGETPRLRGILWG